MRRSTTTGLILASSIVAPQVAAAHEPAPPHGVDAVVSSTINGCLMGGYHVNVDADFMSANGGTDNNGCQTVGARVNAKTAYHFGGVHAAFWSSWEYDDEQAWAIIDLLSTPCGNNNCKWQSWVLVKTNHYRWHGGPGNAEVTTYAK
jgi:hypothetical protein